VGTTQARIDNWNQRVQNLLNELTAQNAAWEELLSIYTQEGWGIGGANELTEDWLSVTAQEQHNAMSFANMFLDFIQGRASLPATDRTGFLQPYLIP
jgi:hypothetical protein